MTRITAVLAVATVLLSAALGWSLLRRSHEAQAAQRATPCDCTDGNAAPPSQPPQPPAGPASSHGAPQAEREPTVAARYTVCEREETRAAIAQLPLLANGPDVWAVHCGANVHLIAFAARHDGAPAPVRIASVRGPSPSQGEAPAAVAPAAADVNGDGRADWIVPALFTDARGVARGSGLYILYQRAAGGFDAPLRLLAAAPGAVAAATLDPEAGRDLVLLHRQDATTARPDELWLIHGGAAPARRAQRPAGVGVDAIAALDLDLDGHDDVAAATAREGRVRLWLSRAGAFAEIEPLELAVAGVQQLLAADLDGDQRLELVVAGDAPALVAASSDAPLAPAPLPAAQGLRDLHLADTDGDGRAELVGYAHPDVYALPHTGGLVERSRVVSLRGEAAVIFARIVQLDRDRDPRPDLMLAVVSADGANVELAIAANLPVGATVRLAAAPLAMPEAAIVERFALP